MKTRWILLLIVFGACQEQVQKNEEGARSPHPLVGNWQFLDKYGNYNEAFFADSVYQTYNRFVDKKVVVDYFVSNDSLHSLIDLRTEVRDIVAGLEWLDNDHVVISTEFVSDTLTRIRTTRLTLQDTDPFIDSLSFRTAFNRRYEDYLVVKGIVSQEEIEAFRERKEIPEDVLRQRTDK